MIQPSVGRIVLYHPHADDGGDPNGQPHAAIVTHVHGARMINLAVFNENGSPYARRSVTLLQDGDPSPGHDFAEWMPYQKGQAAKAEALQAQLTGGAGAAPPPPQPPQAAPQGAGAASEPPSTQTPPPADVVAAEPAGTAS